MYKILKFLVLGSLFLILTSSLTVSAQSFSLKTNLFHWATTTPNLGMEFKIGDKWTMDISGGYNPFTFKENRKLKHWIVFPEIRWWTCESYTGHFLGFHFIGGRYNVGGIDIPIGRFGKLKDYRYEGCAVGAGLTYGYHWILSKRLNLEASVSAGYGYFDYEKFKCPKCGEKISEGNYNYFGLTKATLSLIYFIK
ncbi:hypothetical protein HR11_04220 [Porphyromonas macacae]|uniref:DUF3575 domain-containing protein n=1 Tax=Porphyromonas macacae TaxID=28115 RepID=UPI00052C8F48|nr:DUF3575 domain-containing protein [Porphyromonas macacae]KGN99467.1 hypothetical protein HR11_04220 [Porphyromonas macacae]